MPDTAFNCNAVVFWQTSAFLSSERKRGKGVPGSGSEAAKMAANSFMN